MPVPAWIWTAPRWDAGAACDTLLRPLVQALGRYLLAPRKVHADDMAMPVLASGNGQTKTCRLWVHVRDERNAGSAAPPAV